METSVTTPIAGTVSIEETSITEPTPTGFQLLGQQVDISAPTATTGDPLVIVFRIDSSLIPPGEDETTIQLFKDGVQVSACTGAPGVASPDPCVSSRALLGDADVEITVLASSASAWNFGIVLDTDGDGWSDAAEAIIGTDPLDDCSDDPSHDAFPPDPNRNGVSFRRVDSLDAFLFAQRFGSALGDGTYLPRYDLNGDGAINMLDIFTLAQYFNTSCT